MKKNLSKYTRHKIVKLHNAGASVERIAAETGIRIEKINTVIGRFGDPFKTPTDDRPFEEKFTNLGVVMPADYIVKNKEDGTIY